MGHAHTIRENPGQMAGIAALSAAIGALTAMLFTPRTGEQVRHGIGRRARHGKDAMMEKMHNAKDSASETMGDMKEGAEGKTAEMADKAKRKSDR